MVVRELELLDRFPVIFYTSSPDTPRDRTVHVVLCARYAYQSPEIVAAYQRVRDTLEILWPPDASLSRLPLLGGRCPDVSDRCGVFVEIRIEVSPDEKTFWVSVLFATCLRWPGWMRVNICMETKISKGRAPLYVAVCQV